MYESTMFKIGFGLVNIITLSIAIASH